VYASNLSVTDIAFDAGFENVESFSRAFKKAFAQRPSAFRSQPNWQPWRQTYTLPIFQGRTDMKVNIVDFRETPIAALEHHGEHNLLHQTLNKFIEWRKTTKYRPDFSATYNIIYNDPDSAQANDFRLDVAVAVDAAVGHNDYGIVDKVIPAGRCAVLRHLGCSDNIENSVLYLYREWLPASGEKLRDFPCFFHRVVLRPEHEQITDIYLPIE
jgi:AraC family transcriptional regulator